MPNVGPERIPPFLAQSALEDEPSDARPLRLAAAIVLLVAAADWLFFKERPGASVAAFGALLVGCLIFNRPRMGWDAPTILWLLLVAGALLQSVIEFNFFTFVVLGLLLSAAMADQGAQACGVRCAAWPLALAAGLRVFGRWPQFVGMVARSALPSALGRALGGRSRVRFLRVLVPAILVSVPFLLLFSSGNALLGAHLRAAMDVLADWARRLHFPSLGRVLFWGFIATASLAFLFPRIDPRVAALCSKNWPTIPACDDESVGLWRTLLILIVVNALFFWANGLDACFLWMSAKLPANVSYSEFVHEGALSLTVTTLLSAAVLVVLFQQCDALTRNGWVQGLAMLCIAQNAFLISSVGLRLKLYVEAYELSVLRVHVCTFLVLVVAGYALLVWRIVRGKSLNWLIFSNAAAVLGLFYIVQFVDVSGIVARYNTSCWLERRGRSLDMNYLCRLGPSSLPQLVRIEREAKGTQQARRASQELLKARHSWEGGSRDWRHWQWREEDVRNQVFSTGAGADKPGS